MLVEDTGVICIQTEVWIIIGEDHLHITEEGADQE